MALNDPIVLIAIPLFLFLVVYEVYRKGKNVKSNSIRTLGIIVLMLGLLLMIFLDFFTAFLFIVVGTGIIMVGGFVDRVFSALGP